MGERRIAPPDAEDGPTVGLGVHCGDGGCGGRRVSRDRVRDGGPEKDPRGRRGGEGELGEGVGSQVLRVDEANAVPALVLGPAGLADR